MFAKPRNSTLTQVRSEMKEADIRLVGWNDVHGKEKQSGEH